MDKFFSSLVTASLLLSSSVWAMGHAPQDLSVPSPMIGKAAPDFILGRSDGTTTSFLSARQGQQAILVFWATWCPHCFEELGTINDSLASAQQKGIKILLVDIGETKEDVSNYFFQRQMKLVSFIDQNSVLQETYRLIGVPTLVFIDDKGIIRRVTHAFPSNYANYFSTP